jgi:hypothetical protein
VLDFRPPRGEVGGGMPELILRWIVGGFAWRTRWIIRFTI